MEEQEQSTAREMSMDIGPAEEDNYREKFENLKILVQQQQKELASQKIRNEGVATITTCLQEEREENSQLRSKIQKLEQSMVTLQSRLANGNNGNSVTTEQDAVLPGPSKNIMDNLVRWQTSTVMLLHLLQADECGLHSRCLLQDVRLFVTGAREHSLATKLATSI